MYSDLNTYKNASTYAYCGEEGESDGECIITDGTKTDVGVNCTTTRSDIRNYPVGYKHVEIMDEICDNYHGWGRKCIKDPNDAHWEGQIAKDIDNKMMNH